MGWLPKLDREDEEDPLCDLMKKKWMKCIWAEAFVLLLYTIIFLFLGFYFIDPMLTNSTLYVYFYFLLSLFLIYFVHLVFTHHHFNCRVKAPIFYLNQSLY